MIGNIRGKNHKFTKNTVSKQKYLRQKNKYCTRTINQQDGVRCLDIYSVKNVKIQPSHIVQLYYPTVTALDIVINLAHRAT